MAGLGTIDSFRTASPGRQIMAVAIGAALLCALLVALYFAFLRQGYAVLFTGLRTADASAVVAALDEKKVPYRLEEHGTRILVPSSLVDSTRLAVMGDELPLKGMVGFELFNRSDMGLTEFAQRINYQRALQGELARTIMTLDEVESARVHLSLSEPTIFRSERHPPKASVTIVARVGMRLPPSAVRGIQRLIAAAVPELDTANVAILDERGRILSADEASAADAQGTPAAQEKGAIEQYYAARVRQALAADPEGGSIAVTVWAQARPQTATAIDGAATAPDQPVSSPWQSQNRSFGLRIALTPRTELAPDVQERLRGLAIQAIGFDAGLGDDVTLLPVAAAAPAPAPAQDLPDSVSPNGSDSEAVPVSRAPSMLAFGALGLAAVLILILTFRARRPRRLTDAQRTDYADRLKALLDRENADARS